MLHAYNCILLKMSTGGSKHVEENSILWINNNQCIKFVISIEWKGSVVWNFLFNKTNRCTNLSKFIFVKKLYMIRAVCLPIIRSFPLYIWHGYMPCMFVNSFQARSGWNYFCQDGTPTWSCLKTLIKPVCYTGWPRRNVPDFGRVFLMLKYTDITQNTYVQIWTVTEIMAREVWNFDSCYTLTDCQIHIETDRNMWFL